MKPDQDWTDAKIVRFTRRVSELLTDPARLGRLLAELGIDARHHAKRGCFTGRCPSCRTAGSFYVRYADTETSTYPVFWTCRNRECKSEWRHSSVPGLVREVRRRPLAEAAAWLAEHLGYENAEQVVALPEAPPTKVAVLVDRMAKVARYAREGYCVFFDPKAGPFDFDSWLLPRFKTLIVDMAGGEETAQWHADMLGLSDQEIETRVLNSEVQPIEFRPVGRHWEYKVGEDGTVLRKNKHTGTWHIVEPKLNKEGFAFVELSFEGRVFRYHLSRAVLEAFVGPAPRPGMVPVHRDGDPKNNTVANLRWGEKPKKDNKGERHGRSKLTEADVVEMILMHRKGTTMTRLAELKGVDVSNVSNIVRRKTWKHVTIPSES